MYLLVIFLNSKASRLRRLLKRSTNAKSKKLTALKEQARLAGWNVQPAGSTTVSTHKVALSKQFIEALGIHAKENISQIENILEKTCYNMIPGL